jgi:hypothetical protein
MLILKKLFIVFIFIFCINVFSCIDESSIKNINNELSKITEIQTLLLEIQTQSSEKQFRLFETKNMWTFIELDTATGKMWQIQFDIQGNNRGSVLLNAQDLAVGRNIFIGRFTLYQTQNFYNYILHDQIDGRTWQVQWSQDIGNRFVIPIAE